MQELLKDKRIAVLCGGDSAEREVSLRSGKAVFDALLKRGYSPILIDVSGDSICAELRQNRIDLAFIALHGGCGENGAIQGLLEVLGITYTGSGRLASALAMDKEWSKVCFKSAGLNIAEYVVFQRSLLQKTSKGYDVDIIKYKVVFEYPWVVKPSTEGSSIGVSIVHNDSEIEPAVNNAFTYSDRLLIERYIKGKEIQIGILGDKVLGGVEVRPSSEFYDYKAKYTSGMTQYILPPEIPQRIYDVLKETALKAHLSLGCSGATRVDLILSEDGLGYVLEVNTIPGMTATSLLPKIAGLSGYSFEDLVELILLDAIQTA
ncbi:MAG: D-alanine--D-alanine ligase [Thermodesulfovibrionales bacterium]|nr:D-alanine--D-alanine ligase [Thermodesulfovibrionales bacterium]